MFEQDYMKRLINDIARVLAKILFNKDSENLSEELAEDETVQTLLDELLNVVDSGQIEAAENRIYEMTADKDILGLEIAISFYSYLNDKDDAFLREHYFSREEIKSGVEQLVSNYGISGVSELFL